MMQRFVVDLREIQMDRESRTQLDAAIRKYRPVVLLGHPRRKAMCDPVCARMAGQHLLADIDVLNIDLERAGGIANRSG